MKDHNRMFNAVFVLVFLWIGFLMGSIGVALFMLGRWLAIW